MDNSITLVDYMGSDEMHGLAAWASTFAEFNIEMPDTNRVDVLVNHILNNGKKKKSIEELLAFLAENKHNSPFRFSSFVFTATTDIATHIQKLKHTVLLEAENGESARYKELKEDKFYLPWDWSGIEFDDSKFSPEVAKIFNGFETWKQILERSSEINNELYHNCLDQLVPVLGRKRAKESARYFKMYNSQMNTLNKLSFDGIVQFYYKRHDANVAQTEIAEFANGMVNQIKAIPGNPFKYSLKAFNL